MALASRRGDGHLWVIALGLSFLVNGAILGIVGFTAIETAILRKKEVPPPPPQEESVATILAEIVQAGDPAVAVTAPDPAEPAEKKFARTSPDQAAPPEKPTPFIGERNTRATSDRAPTPDAPELPSQAGIAPRDEMDIETTESKYQDGSLVGSDAPAAEPMPPAPPEPPPAPEVAESSEKPAPPTPETMPSTPAPREKLLDGPNPVDVQVAQSPDKEEAMKPAPEDRKTADSPPETKPADEKTKPADKTAESTPKSKPTTDPAFKGYQRKTAVVGSISRGGRSSLDVEDSALGRYQAAISRAVELEWQRNCVRHRDYITPGFLTARFFVQPNGKVRSVQFVGDMETGEVQKGFTLNSIRNAEIPAMPPALRKEYDKEPLELIFRFFF